MPEKHLFEYAVIRVVPCVEREEFINAGVILYCASKNFLRSETKLDILRLQALNSSVDVEEIESRLATFTRICAGKKEGGKIGEFPLSGRFRWLTSTRSTIIQTSPVHPGLCDDPEEKLQKLFRQLVLKED